MTTLLEVIDGGTTYLEKRGIAEARLNMQRLVSHFLGFTRVQLYLEFDRPLSEDQLVPIRDALKQRGQAIPLQHILGEVEFMGLDFKSTKQALIPRPETEELVSLILKEELPAHPRILDVGTGSGVIGLSLAHHLEDPAEVVLADYSPEALSLAQENASALELTATFVESNLFSQVTGSFDLVVANLPYVPERDRDSLAPELAHDPELALFSGQDGLDLVRTFCAQISDFLNPGGLVAMEVGHEQGEITASYLQKDDNLHQITVKTDLSDIARFPFARRK